jgi:hypothetical protein
MYDQASNTATIGAGLTWDTVYSKLEPFGVTVVGGRVVGVGVGGVTLGGGKDIVHFSDAFPSRAYSSHQVIRGSLIDTDW